MDMALRKDLQNKLDSITPEYGMAELTYPSFMRCAGYRTQPLSAADSDEAVQALLHVGGGVKLEIEVEGARNGGEWFGGGKAWKAPRWRDGDAKNNKDGEKDDVQEEVEPAEKKEIDWWLRNFWLAYDSLNE